MMTEEQRLKVAELKAAILASAPTHMGASRGVRVAAVALKKELKRAGITGAALAEALGVHVTTLCRWASEAGGEVVVRAKRGAAAAPKRQAHAAPKPRGRAARFRMVEVTPATATPATSATGVPIPKSAPRSLRVAHAPSGLVIDGLDVETLAALLRRMS